MPEVTHCKNCDKKLDGFALIFESEYCQHCLIEDQETDTETYKEFQAALIKKTDDELVKEFNSEDRSPGWITIRARFMGALPKEFERRGIDYSVLGKMYSMLLDQKIDIVNSKVTLI
jgi:hypothetical protein